ncbi:MAG TPA: hypothetical protein VKX17_02265 [Planctomycetota bacterium]|nr:hypothetical protein [Planctomycetota bacterium]
MATPPRRGRFQIHLSTAIVMMFVAGGIIWANVKVRPIELRPDGSLSLYAPIDRDRLSTAQFAVDLARVRYEYSIPFGTIAEDEREPDSTAEKMGTHFSSETSILGYGWPAVAVTDVTVTVVGDKARDRVDSWRAFSGYSSIVIDLFLGVVILSATCFLCEWLIRRRTARKGD